MSGFKIVTLKSGCASLRSMEHGETYHPVTGPMAEAETLHVRQQRLVERSTGAANFVIWDVGFGAAANAIAAMEALANTKAAVEIHSFDKTTAPIEFALDHAGELSYLRPHAKLIRSLLAESRAQAGPRIQWRLHLGNFVDQVRCAAAPPPHAILYDPYSAATNPEMWTLEHFQQLRQRLAGDAPCLLTNYTRSTAVRVTLLIAGFVVGKGCAVGEKEETTIASNQLELLAQPLDRSWLERVRNSTNSAPLREAGSSRTGISPEDFARLESHAQFAQNGADLQSAPKANEAINCPQT